MERFERFIEFGEQRALENDVVPGSTTEKIKK